MSDSKYLEIASRIAKKCEEKNIAYGNTAGKSGQLAQILFSNTAIPQDVLLIARVLDKLARLAHNNDPHGEDPWEDIAGYAILAIKNREGKPR